MYDDDNEVKNDGADDTIRGLDEYYTQRKNIAYNRSIIRGRKVILKNELKVVK